MAHNRPSVSKSRNEPLEGHDSLRFWEQLQRASLDDDVERTRTHFRIREITGHERLGAAAPRGMVVASMHFRAQLRRDEAGVAESHRAILARRESGDPMHGMLGIDSFPRKHFGGHGREVEGSHVETV
jgi:hypothetical protein